ncbi:uncharacterized protein MYCFIDRAFT_208982 [Pseudocercospora fijiensis CIRAD86]|uniref:Thioesterase domain-containing protein n=1 Tax=Pseudocercospora fijiensis (strain CIRAD86) TaxID=383855 RepID=M3A246_PSEFD|nr:uncharacterized protein MYCFIDRAFT_208982 [Pseudocercospora fijiensis CIRAD86]EME78466.1 hypothetical protein MYCFIDRAFT_208982 [Pseudocercospora fijiensis CIRAD86]
MRFQFSCRDFARSESYCHLFIAACSTGQACVGCFVHEQLASRRHFHASPTMTSDERLQQGLQIVGEAINIEPYDFQDHETWKFLGLGDMLAAATASDLVNAGIPVPVDVFARCPTVGEFKAFLVGDVKRTENAVQDTATSAPVEPADPWEGVPKPKVPLSVVLQGQPDNASTVAFLLPDGSGAGTSYGTLPTVGGNVCLIGLNSPFLRQAENFTCSIERMARLWINEIRKYQPKDRPYTLGGWSAGGYYSFEVTKLLTAAGEKVERLILIDSPCRLRYEALPAQVVAELTKKGLMGASGAKKAPEWLVQHFTSTVLSVEKYTPVPLPQNQVPPKVNLIWVKDGLVKSVPESGLDVDMKVKVTRFLLEPRPHLQSEGWEILLPGATFTFDYMTGNHFQITQPPHVSSSRALTVLVTSPRVSHMASDQSLCGLMRGTSPNPSCSRGNLSALNAGCEVIRAHFAIHERMEQFCSLNTLRSAGATDFSPEDFG